MNAVGYVHKICEYYYAPCSALHNATTAKQQHCNLLLYKYLCILAVCELHPLDAFVWCAQILN